MQRREFLEVVATGAGVLGIAPGWALAQGAPRRADFQQMVKSRFYLSNADGSAHGGVRLLKLEQDYDTPRLSQYTLVFRGGRNLRLPEGIYGADNWDGHPYFKVYIQPARVDRRDREVYLAVFSEFK